MALHGDIRVNGVEIAQWEAVRSVTHFVDEPIAYECLVKYLSPRGVKSTFDFQVWHLYSDGAFVLARKVLAEAHTRLADRVGAHA